MRVAFVAANTAHHRETDFTARMRRLRELLVDRGHEICVFCSQWWEGRPDEFEHDGIRYRAIMDDVDGPGWRFVTGAPRPIRRFDPDIIHGVNAMPRDIFGAWMASIYSRTPLLLEWYDPNPALQWSSRMRRLSVTVPDHLVVPANTIETRVRELGRKPDDIEIIPTGIELDLIRSIDPADGADIVYSRTLDDAANLESLLLALAELRDHDWRVVVIGDGPERRNYERQATDLRIADRIEFVGDCSLEERIARFKDSHVYVQTALRTSFPIDLIRALACGCLGIVEYQAESSAHEFVEQEPRGFLTTSESELTQAIVDAGAYEHLDYDESFAEYDENRIIERYLERYETLRR
ncbi:MAG: glycosyltransferase [Halobacteriales archaeon]